MIKQMLKIGCIDGTETLKHVAARILSLHKTLACARPNVSVTPDNKHPSEKMEVIQVNQNGGKDRIIRVYSIMNTFYINTCFTNQR